MILDKACWELTRVKPTHVKTIRQVHKFANTTSVTRNTANRARPMLRNSSSVMTWENKRRKLEYHIMMRFLQ